MLRALREINRKRKYGEPVIVVSGLPRSGTSMMMNMLDAARLELVKDGIRTADEDNPKGYFEDERVKDLEQMDDKVWVRNCRGKVIKVISFLLRHLPEENFYKVIFMRRNLEEIIASQNKMLVRRGEPVDEASDAKMIQNYRDHLLRVDVMLRMRPHFDALHVDYKQVLENPAEQAARVAEFLGDGLDADPMTAVVDKALYRNRR